MTTEPQVTVGLVGSDVLLAPSETPRTDTAVNSGGNQLLNVAEECRKLERENAGLRLACEDWIKIANSGANKLNDVVWDRNNERRRVDWLADHPESAPYLEDGLWRIPYLVSGAGGFGGGVGTMNHRTLRGVIDLALANKKAQTRSGESPSA